MSSEEIRLRSDLLGTLVVTRDTGKKLGVISQLWVDVDQRKVVALSLRPNLLYGTPQPMLLSSIRQIGDVILVDDEDVIEDMDPEVYNSLVNCEVVTETGELLGKVRGFKFDVDTGELTSLIIASLGLPLIPDQMVSTYELGIEEIVSSGPDRLIVFEGSEQRLMQLTVGVLERLGIGRAPWERDDEDAYIAPIRTDNQLPTGLRTPISTPIREREREPALEAWDEDTWEQPRQLRQEQRQMEPAYYEEDDDANWSEASGRDRYDRAPRYPDERYDDSYDDYEATEDEAWESEERKTYRAPRLEIPEKTKAPEYEEEGY
ncbi:MAG TPA: PRC-barrel domain-containing protein [Leptolyngbyaceae cyanobacterium M33_DOE_097]|uniref:PRC-barrel domain containing protein n=1 Tax=Oscillatoriales cyanobacterium SpSt-418 TaxID=2282169 RepID=A0A7C3PJH5_9CYAN|nr:PRC-barrel domain-containing protein [Leptolyngbyaceae cyanobacterium M33_DOE_097]